MNEQEPTTSLDPRFRSPDATATRWSIAVEQLEKAELFWLTTVRPDGHPHVTPLLALWLDGALYFSTGASERKARNIAHNPQCILTTGCNSLDEEGLDAVLIRSFNAVRRPGNVERYADEWKAFHLCR